MKDKDQIFAIFALTLSLGIPLLELLLHAIFEDENKDLSMHPQKVVTNESELAAALSDTDLRYIKLDADIILLDDLVFNHDVVLDLGGHKLASLAQGARVIDIKCGCITITGKGSIVANGLGSAAVRIKGAMTADNVSYSGLLIDEDVTLYAPNYYGLFLTPNCQAAYGVEVNFKGSMIARDGFCINGNIQGRGDNAPRINLLDGARVIVDENDGLAIYAPGFGRWEIGSVEMIGSTGIAASTGEFHLVGSTIIATGTALTSREWYEEMASSGAVFQLNNAGASIPTLDIRSGEYISRQGHIFTQNPLPKTTAVQLNLQGGDFVGVAGIFQNFPKYTKTIEISGGNFSSNINDYLSLDFRSEYDRSARVYRIYNRTKTIEAPSPAATLENARSKLRLAVLDAKFYLSADYAGDSLGNLQAAADKALASLKRAKTAADKVLSGAKTANTEQIENLLCRLEKAKSGVQAVEDELRADIMEIMASARALDPTDYSRYSYRLLMESVEDTDILLVQKQVSLFELYSAFCDVNMNLELLDDPEEDEELEEIFVPRPPQLATPRAPELSPSESIPAELSPDVEPETIEAATEVSDENFDVDAIEESDELLTDAEITIQTTAVLGALALAEAAPFNPELEQARSNLRDLLNALTILNPSDYTTETYYALHELVVSASDLLNQPDQNLSLNLLQTAYQQINFAYLNLIKKSHDPIARALDEARENLYSVLEVVSGLSLSDYDANSAEQFGELQVAIAKANAHLQNPHIRLEEIVAVLEEIQLATSGLKTTAEPVAEPAPAVPAASTPPVAVTTPPPAPIVEPIPQNASTAPSAPSAPAAQPAPAIDWSALREVIADISALNPNAYSASSYNRLLSQLEYTKSISDDPRLTQSIVDDIVFELNLSVLALEPISPAETTNSVYEDALLPIAEASGESNANVTPNLLMSMMAGAYAGLATYRRSRTAAKHRK